MRVIGAEQNTFEWYSFRMIHRHVNQKLAQTESATCFVDENIRKYSK